MRSHRNSASGVVFWVILKRIVVIGTGRLMLHNGHIIQSLQLGSKAFGSTSVFTERDSNLVTEVRRCLFIDPPVIESGEEGTAGQLEGSVHPGTARYTTLVTHVLSGEDDVSGIGLVPMEVLYDAVESLNLETMVAGPSQ